MIEDDIVKAARGQLGTPFRWQGREPGTGLDCVGLIAAVCSEVGIDVSDYCRYAPNSDYSGILQAMLEKSFVQVDEIFEGAFAAFHLKTPGVLRHAGIIAKDERGEWMLIHTTETTKKVVEVEYGYGWAKRIESFWRVK